MRFELNVVRGHGPPHQISFEASSLRDVNAKAASLGYAVLSVSHQPRWLSSRPLQSSDPKLDVSLFVEQLRDLLGAGLSVVECLDTLRRGSVGDAGAALESIEQRLREGKALSEALADSASFPELLVALVRASELTSDLPQTLTRFLEHERRVAEIRHRLMSAAIYPILLVVVGGAVLSFLLLYVMPRFAKIFEGMNGELPWSAHVMVGWSHLLRAHGTLLFVGVASVVIAVTAALFRPSWRAAASRQVLDMQPFRSRLRTYFLARWYRATGMLVEGGIPLVTSLGLTAGLLPSGMRGAGLSVQEAVRQGLSPSQAHVRAGMATPVAEQLLLAGERTGDLGSVLSRIAHFHESEVSRSLEQTMRAVEPIVMVLIGLGVGVVVVLMYLPIFELASAIK